MTTRVVNVDDIVYHYTTGMQLRSIVETGEIRPYKSKAHGKRERPAVWFSAHQYWEPTATKGIRSIDGSVRDCTMEEMIDKCGGLARIGLLKTYGHLIRWDEFLKVSGIKSERAKGLAKYGRLIGADPNEWYACTKPVPWSEFLLLDLMWSVKEGWTQWNGQAE